MPPDVQHFLARLYTDDALRERFVADRAGVARELGFDEEQARRLALIDVEVLNIAARSFAKKRAAKHR